MAANDNSLSINNNDHGLEYYEEVDDYTLDFLNQKGRSTKAPIKPIRESTQIIDPVQQFNKELNRQYRPDLVVPTPDPPSESPISVPSIPQTPAPDPLIFDAHAKPVKPVKLPEEKEEPSISVKHKIRDRIHQLTAPTPLPIPPTPSEELDQDNLIGTVLVPPPQQQPQQQMTRNNKPSQYPPPHPIVSEYHPPTVNNSNSFKNNKVAPPPSHADYYTQKNYQNKPHKPIQYSSSSYISPNPLMQSKSITYSRPNKNLIDQSKIDKKKSKKKSVQDTMNTNRSYALYNQQNGRIEGIVKNRLNVATDEAEESRIVDDEAAPKTKLALWLSQPLCLGLKRLSGGLLFGSMILLGTASFAGLIASIVTYSQDSVNDAQWKILGMVVCSIMLITIIVTLIVFICCYKYGYMFNKDEDIDPNDPSATHDAEGNERQKAVLRKIYKFNRPVDTSSIPSDMVRDVSTTASVSNTVVQVNDKQTNTEATIAVERPKDIDRGVWASTNAYGGIAYRPLIQPTMVSRIVQVLPEDFEEIYQPTQVIYQVIAPPTTEIQPRYIQVPAQQPSYIEVIESKPKQSRIIQQAPIVEVIETKQTQPRTKIIRQPQSQQIIVQPTTSTHYEYVDIEEPQTTRRKHQTQYEYVDVEETQTVRRKHQPQYEYVDIEEPRTVRRKHQPQYEYVEEITDQSDISSVEEIIDAPKHLQQQQQQGKKKDSRKGFGKVSVKHIKSTNDDLI